MFCEQEKITSQPKREISEVQVTQILTKAIFSKGFDPVHKPEIAFYGGTFTRLPLDHMRALLEAAALFVEQGYFHGIRVSTRPDALDEERLNTMKDRGVVTVELGAQSMDDRVLALSERGHTVADTVDAVVRLKDFGFTVGVQLMPGLPGDSNKTFSSTITKVIALRPHMVRLYPALVIQGTALAQLCEKGAFQPLPLDEAIEICVEACVRLENEGIPVIRIGLMSSPSLLKTGRIIAGPWHPAFGFLVRSAIYHRNMAPLLPRQGEASQIRITAAKRDIPLLRGYKNQGLKELQDKTGARTVLVETDDSLPPGKTRVDCI